MPRTTTKPHQETEPTEGPGRAWLNVFLMVSGFLVIFMVCLLVFVLRDGGRRDAWADAVKASLDKEGSSFDAMAPVMEGLDRLDWDELAARREKLELVARAGWTPDADLDSLLLASQPVISLVGRSAAIPKASFPSLLGYELDRPLPHFDRFWLLTQLLVANARRLEAQGEREEAVQRLIELATLGSRFARPPGEASYASHGLAITMMEQAVGVTAEVVRGGKPLPAEALRRIDLQLQELEEKYVPLRSAVYDELDLFEHMARNRTGSPEELAVVLQCYDTSLTRAQAGVQAKDLFGLVPSLPQELEQLKPSLDAALAKPDAVRPVFDDAMLATLSTNPLALLPLRPVGALSMREQVMRTRLRLARALCQHLIDPNAAVSVVDPFAGVPLVYTGTSLVSVGPDRFLENGARIYNPQSGLASAGDVVLTLEPPRR
ncbi:hypothetical protein GC173_02200 [bacterium]|nr:hypothetical protein [bacterium]